MNTNIFGIKTAALIGIAIFIFTLSACVPAVAESAPLQKPGITPSPIVTKIIPTTTKEPSPTVTKIATPTATETATPTATPTFTPTPTPEFEACLLIKGELLDLNIFVGDMSGPMAINLYLPPCYKEDGEREFPILYMIHGKPYFKDQWVDLGLIITANEMIAAGQIPPMIIVLPEDVGADYPIDDFFDEDLINDVIPYIEENYLVKEGRENRAIGGLSRGANWAMHIGLNHPEMFSSLGLHSLAISISYEEGEIEGWLDEIPSEVISRIYIDYGDEEFDLLKNSIAEFMHELEIRDFEFEFNEFPGGHDKFYWSSNVEKYLLFYGSSWE